MLTSIIVLLLFSLLQIVLVGSEEGLYALNVIKNSLTHIPGLGSVFQIHIIKEQEKLLMIVGEMSRRRSCFQVTVLLLKCRVFAARQKSAVWTNPYPPQTWTAFLCVTAVVSCCRGRESLVFGGNQKSEAVPGPVPPAQSVRPGALHLWDSERLPSVCCWKGTSTSQCYVWCSFILNVPIVVLINLFQQIDNGPCICAAMPNKITILRHNDNLNKYCIRKVQLRC